LLPPALRGPRPRAPAARPPPAARHRTAHRALRDRLRRPERAGRAGRRPRVPAPPRPRSPRARRRRARPAATAPGLGPARPRLRRSPHLRRRARHPHRPRPLGGLGQAGADPRRRAEPRRQHRAGRRGHAPRLRPAAPQRGPRRIPRLAGRPVGSAVTELIAAARGEDALLRGLAFEALRVVGAPAEPEVRAVVDDPTLRPYALLWLAEHDGADPEDAHEILTREEATWLWVDTAAAVADHGEAPLLVRHLESAVQPTVPALLTEVRAVGHPRTVQVLVALAAAHPDPALAKAVRRAAFQVHTGG